MSGNDESINVGHHREHKYFLKGTEKEQIRPKGLNAEVEEHCREYGYY